MHDIHARPRHHIMTQQHHCFYEQEQEVVVVTYYWQLGQVICIGNLVKEEGTGCCVAGVGGMPG